MPAGDLVEVDAGAMSYPKSIQIHHLQPKRLQRAQRMNFRNFDEFWAFYLSQHSKPSTRRWHFAATLSSFLCIFLAFLLRRWILLLVAPSLGYGLAWYSHFFVEGNTPATFGHPIWSYLCDLKMFALILTGQMDREIKRIGKRSDLQTF